VKALTRPTPAIAISALAIAVIGGGSAAAELRDSGGANTTVPSSGDGAAEMPSTITIGQYTLANPYGLAIEEGWFEEAFPETDVEFVELEGTANALAGLSSGDLDVALIGTPGAATALSQGLDISVVWIYEVIDSAEALVLRGDVPFEDASDLAGLTLATPFGSTAHYAILSYLEANGLTESDVELVDLGPSDLSAAFERGDIDGGWINEPNVTRLVNDAGGKVAVTTGDLQENDVVIADIAAVSNEFAETYPEALRTYTEVLDRSTQAFLADPEASYATMGTYLNLEPTEVQAIMDGYRFLTAEEQAADEYLGGGLADSIYQNALIWEEQDRVPQAADEETIRAAVVPDFLRSWTG
jgi:taurine transport system substrate-binding protein